jgi:branched-chain amino acid transport system substrate-binding protein
MEMTTALTRRTVLAAAPLLLTGAPAFAQQAPLKLGTSVSLSGTLAQSGDKVGKGYKLWVDDVNGRGGLLGRKVELIIYDDQSDAGTSARLFEKLITDDKVDMTIGPYGSAASFAASAVTEKHRMPTLLPSAASDAIFNRGFKYIFQMFPPLKTIFEPLLGDAGQAAGFARIAILHSSDLYPKSVTAAVEATAKKYNREIVLNEEFPLNASDLSSLMLKLRQARPDLVVGGAQLPDALTIIRQLRDIGYSPNGIALSPGPLKDDFASSLGADADGIMADYIWEPVSTTPESLELIKKWSAAYKDAPDVQSAFGWCGGKVLEAAVGKAGSLDLDQLRAAYLGLEMKTALPGIFKLAPETGAQIGQQLGVVQWQKGKRQIVAPKEIATAEMTAPLTPWDKR